MKRAFLIAALLFSCAEARKVVVDGQEMTEEDAASRGFRSAQNEYDAGRYAEAASIGAWFADLNRDLFDPLFVDRRVDGAYDKVIAKLGGLDDFPLRMLSPYRTVSDAEYARTKRTLQERHPDCA